MKLGIIGATGKAGQLILEEAVQRELDVTAIVRSPEKLNKGDYSIMEKDANDLKASDVEEFDVVVNALGFEPENAHLLSELGSKVIDAVDEAGSTRFITIGHAGTLFKNGDRSQRLFEGDSFPEDFKPVANHHLKNLEKLEAAENLEWTFICPASFFDPEGRFTGKYEVGGDVRIKNSECKSYLSYADLASAVVDEVIKAEHIGEQVSVVGEKE